MVFGCVDVHVKRETTSTRTCEQRDLETTPHPIATGSERQRRYLGDDGGLLTTGELGQLAELEGNLDQGTEGLLGLVLVLGRVRLVLLNIETDSGTLRSSARQANDQARAILKDNANTLFHRCTLTVST